MDPIVAILFDCDGTLAPDTTDSFLQSCGVDTVPFWKEMETRVEQGWDPPLAYLTKIIELARSEALPELTRSSLKEFGKTVQPFPGLPEMFTKIREWVSGVPKFADAGIEVEYYIISSGIQDIIENTSLAAHMRGVFACRLTYDGEDRPVSVRTSVTFTEKTKFIYSINKGITPEELGTNPYAVNDAIAHENRRVPFSNMIYIGDGPSDIPCFSMVKANGGEVLGVSEKPRKGYELARGNRLTLGPYTPDYRSGSDMRRMLETAIERICDDIVLQRQQRRTTGPSHG